MLGVAIVAFSLSGGFARGAQQQPAGTDAYTEVIPPGINSARELREAIHPDATRLAAPVNEPRSARASSRSRGKRLVTGFGDVHFTSGDASTRSVRFDTTKRLNGGAVRLYTRWRGIAPTNPTPAFDASNPNSPGYNWSTIDAAVSETRAHGLQPILLITSAPDWAEGSNRPSYSDAPAGTWKPDPQDVAAFGAAIAKRYSGSFGTLPRVRDFMLWNEPNLPMNLMPQTSAPSHYRSMLNAFYGAVHGVKPSNRVITGGTAPYGGGPSYGGVTTRPLEFWREVMCVNDNRRLSPKKCPQKPRFDVLAHHPIDTSGGPHTSAINDDDVSTPDLHNLVDVLRAAEGAGNVRPGGRQRPVWATELWWESDPPDPYPSNPSLSRQAQWYEEALYVLWKQGASMVLFYQVRDDRYNGSPGRSSYETGVQFADGKSKPSSRAVQFPFVADRKSKRKVLLWGIAPRRGKLVVTQKGKGKRRVASFKVSGGKIFTKSVKLRGRHELHAAIGKKKSLGWSLK